VELEVGVPPPPSSSSFWSTALSHTHGLVRVHSPQIKIVHNSAAEDMHPGADWLGQWCSGCSWSCADFRYSLDWVFLKKIFVCFNFKGKF
jgi:hypothetical protein